MFRISYFVLIFVLTAKANDDDTDMDYVHMRVYYESQCPDSRNFFVQQLDKTLALLHKYIVLELIPFGKAHSINQTEFKCQHGPTECLGNMVQACTLDALAGRVDDRQVVKYVRCELKTEAGTRKDWQCVKQSGANVTMVKQCVSSGKGIELQLKNERKTKQLKPKYIPAVTFDGIFDQKDQDAAMEDLLGTVCNILNYSAAPCRKMYKKPSKQVKPTQISDEYDE